MRMFRYIPEDATDGISLTARNVVYLIMGGLVGLILVGILALVKGIAHRRALDAAVAARDAAIADRDTALALRQALISALVRLSHTWDQESITRAAAPSAMQQRCALELRTYLNEPVEVTP